MTLDLDKLEALVRRTMEPTGSFMESQERSADYHDAVSAAVVLELIAMARKWHRLTEDAEQEKL